MRASTFIHIGDLHIQSTHPRNADRLRAFDQIIDENVNRPDLAAWLIPGDIFHARSSAQDRIDVAERLVRMANKAVVLAVYGNHDGVQDLHVFAKLAAVHPICVIARPEVVYIRTATGENAAVFAMPYPTRGGLVAAGVPSEGIVDAARGALDLIFMDAAARLAEARKAGMLTMMIAHVNVGGAIMGSGQPSIGHEIEVDQALLDRLGPIPKLLSHVHKAQEIGGAFYAGSICRLDWSEIDPKRYLTVEYESVDAYRIVSHPIDVAPMYLIEGTLDRQGFSWRIHGCDCGETFCGEDTTAICESADRSWEDCEVRVRYRFVAADKAILDEGRIRAVFAGAKRLELDPIAEHTRAVRAPEVAAAQTLDEKLKAVAKAAGVEWTTALTEKLALLQQAPDGAAFLSAIEDNLTVIDVDVPQEVCQ